MIGGGVGVLPPCNEQRVITISVVQTPKRRGSIFQRTVVLVQGTFKTSGSYRSVVWIGAINRIIALLPTILATGADNGVIKVPPCLLSFPWIVPLTQDH